MEKYNMTREEYDKLKQNVINLRISATHEQGSEYHSKIWEELLQLEDLLQYARITDSTIVDNNIILKPEMPDNKNIIEKPMKR